MLSKPHIVIVDQIDSESRARLYNTLSGIDEQICDIRIFADIKQAIEFIEKGNDIVLIFTELVFGVGQHDGIRLIEEFGHKFPIAVTTYDHEVREQILLDLKTRGIDIFGYVSKDSMSRHVIREIYERAIKHWKVKKSPKPLFISYSHSDSAFVDRLEKEFRSDNLRYWRDVHDGTSGRLEKQIVKAIEENRTVLLVLSVNSINSDWVQHEARLARQQELKSGSDVLCPIALDESWKTCRWPERLKEQITEYNILDFSKWTDNYAFQKAFSKLSKGLRQFYSVKPAQQENSADPKNRAAD